MQFYFRLSLYFISGSLCLTNAGKLLMVLVLAIGLSACGGGTSSSGADAQTNVSGNLVGVYNGTETLRLFVTSNPDSAVTDEREVTVTISQDGRITIRSVSTRNSTTGSGQLRRNNSFTLIADARTQFAGLCESGTLFLDGSVTPNKVTGSYRSSGLICNGTAYTFDGELMAGR